MIDHDTIEATDLYAMVFSDDCKCTSAYHKDGRVPVCSAEVTHYRSNCRYRGLVCSNTATYIQNQIETEDICAGCGNLIRNCWKVVAI